MFAHNSQDLVDAKKADRLYYMHNKHHCGFTVSPNELPFDN